MASLEKELELRVGLFAHSVIENVIKQCKATSNLSGEVYEKLEKLWRRSLSAQGGVPTPTVAAKGQVPTRDMLNTNPRLSAILPPVKRTRGLEGVPLPYMPLIASASSRDKEPARIREIYALKDASSLHMSKSVEVDNKLDPESLHTLFGKRKRTQATPQPIMETDTTNGNHNAINKGNETRLHQDVVLGCLVLVDVSQLPDAACNGSAGESQLKAARVIQIYRDKRSSAMSVRLRWTDIPNSYIPADSLRPRPRSGLELLHELIFPWPHVAIHVPFLDTADGFVVNRPEDASPLAGDRAMVDMAMLLDDVLGVGDVLEGDETFGIEAVWNATLDLEDLLAADSASSAVTESAGKHLPYAHYATEDVILVTGERISKQSLEEMDEHFTALRRVKRRLMLTPASWIERYPNSNVIDLDAEEDPSIPLPTPELTVVGKLQRFVRNDGTWSITLEGVYVRTGEALSTAQRMDMILPLLKIRINASHLFQLVSSRKDVM
jgi:hypothetical protein